MVFGRGIVVVLLGAALAGCAGNTRFGAGPNETTGTVVGAVAGAAAGSQLGRGGGRVTAAVAGAAIGGLIGNQIGAALDDDDRTRAYEAQMQALDSGASGAPVSWRNEDSGRYGTIVPGPAYQRNAMTCRQYTHTVYIEGRPQVARRIACRNPNGTWTAVG
jgi:surface antigen